MGVKQCAFCSWKTNDPNAVADHMQERHGWTAGVGSPQQFSGSHTQRNAVLIFIGLLIVWFFLVTGGSPSSSPAAATSAKAGAFSGASTAIALTPTPEPPHIGSVVEAGNWRYSVRQVDTSKTYTVGSGFLATTYTAKGLWVIVLIQLTNIGKENFSINQFDFELHDSKGIKYNPESSYAFNLPPGYTNFGEQMPPGVPQLARLYFDVAPATTGMYLLLTNVGLLQKPSAIYLY